MVSSEGGSEPLWSPKGNEIFYRSGARVMAVPIRTRPQLEAGSPQVLFEGHFYSAAGAKNFDAAPDGEHFLLIGVEEPKLEVKVVFNWFEELKRLAPSR
jgi:hypothetical protein